MYLVYFIRSTLKLYVTNHASHTTPQGTRVSLNVKGQTVFGFTI